MRWIMLTATLASIGATSALAADARYVKTPTIGCYDRDVLDRTQDMRDDDRRFAARELMQDGLANGVCRQVAPGMMVRVDDDDILAGLSKVRADGEAMAIWVRTETLSDD